MTDKTIDELTIRGYFAAMAMHGLLANPNVDCGLATLVESAILYADELLKQLEQ